ncbi:MAG: hypothetical protein V4719_10040, partial [Planctomycetota bacterium]
MPVFHTVHAIARYQPSSPKDCSPDEYAARCDLCQVCPHRKHNACELDGVLISVRARRQASRCHASKWPGQEPLIMPAAPAPEMAFPMVANPLPIETPLKTVQVVFITPGVQRGGAERWILSLCRWMQSPVLAVVSTSMQIDAGMRKELQRAEVPVIAHPTNPLEAREAMQAADVVICWGIGKVAEYLEGIDTPVVWVSHGACQWTMKLVYEAVGRVNHWVSVSEMARRVFPEEVQRVATVIHNGVDVDRTSPIRGRQLTRAALGLRDNQIAVGYLGRFSPEKRPAAVAEAVACLPERYVAVMAGDGWNDAETRAEAM